MIFLLLAGGLVLGGDVQDAVGVDVEGDFDLRDAARGRRDAVQAEAAQGHVVASHRAFALQDVDVHGGLAVGGGRIGLGLAHRDGGVAVDHLGHHAAHGFHAQRERGHVEQQDILDFAAQHAGLDGRADRHDLIGVDALVGFLAIGQLCGPVPGPSACGWRRRPARLRSGRRPSGWHPSRHFRTGGGSG